MAKRNPQDATRRNVQAANKRLARIEEAIIVLLDRAKAQDTRLAQLEKRLRRQENQPTHAARRRA
jgi:predicted mannosyl-3-phosphoglycerate phosphatase (HAD superfamily)